MPILPIESVQLSILCGLLQEPSERVHEYPQMTSTPFEILWRDRVARGDVGANVPRTNICHQEDVSAESPLVMYKLGQRR
jgi:hypothetical protein